MSQIISSYSPLAKMNHLEMEIFELIMEISPQSLYVMGVEELGDKIFIPSKENLKSALSKIRKIKEKCRNDDNGTLARKYLESVETQTEFEEPLPDVGMITEILAFHLIKEGIQVERLKKLLDQMIASINTSLDKYVFDRHLPLKYSLLT